MRRLLPLLLVAALAMGCAAAAEEETGSSDDALSLETLTAAACATPTVTTKLGGEPGSAMTSIEGCIVGKPGESGNDTSRRAAALLGDTARIGHVLGKDGKPVFAKFAPGPSSGTLATGLVEDVDVTLSMFGSPSSRLRVTRKLSGDGVYSVRITNVTAFQASVMLFPVTAIEAGRLTLEVHMKPEANGLTVTGNGTVLLSLMQDQAGTASEIVGDLFGWLTTELQG
jgi:hypothetical protein